MENKGEIKMTEQEIIEYAIQEFRDEENQS